MSHQCLVRTGSSRKRSVTFHFHLDPYEYVAWSVGEERLTHTCEWSLVFSLVSEPERQEVE
jgi:hypothetical protein